MPALSLTIQKCRSFSNGWLQLVNPTVVNVSVQQPALSLVQKIWARRQDRSSRKLFWPASYRCCLETLPAARCTIRARCSTTQKRYTNSR
ncbi:hypothetical protein PICMEDRAFT_87182 [Pichia membranifaciens NRRL Y-2026]|uniref:Uncharacterized protein n=1 Tax=Pichia membranifaciens NRRL Y-2026 TaxID=763406 RepID=A0A1E3NRU9_9ASCO|nr:hypothetical protein PICMEDRAFT_87182 [Pichia membranifaciens NRRL Y-2026]ODQ48801.1 hypothetical protein PICMEDRAFT_87182 [Pichia membranifaciens NRRL Y-2026]